MLATRTLEFDRVVDAVTALALTPLGAAALSELEPSTDPRAVVSAQEATSETVRFLERHPLFPLRAGEHLPEALASLRMTPRRPPVLAQTLLEWVDPANDALHGDLLEEFASGRSRSWYWNQVFAAAGVAIARPVRVHGLSGLEPAMFGLMMLFMLGFYVVFVVNVTDWLMRFEGVYLFQSVPPWLARWPIAAPLLALVGGWLVGRVVSAGGDHRVARVVGFGATTMLCAIGGLQAAEELSSPVLLLPQFYQQVGTTAAFIGGLLGGVGAAMMLKPGNAPLALAEPVPTLVSP